MVQSHEIEHRRARIGIHQQEVNGLGEECIPTLLADGH